VIHVGDRRGERRGEREKCRYTQGLSIARKPMPPGPIKTASAFPCRAGARSGAGGSARETRPRPRRRGRRRRTFRRHRRALPFVVFSPDAGVAVTTAGGDRRRGHRQEGEPAGSKVKADALMSSSYFSYSPRRSKGAMVDGLRWSGQILRHEAGQGRCRDVGRGQAGAAPGCWARPPALATT
jgi:hypothetical protein